jgi:hypothetical protein
MSDRSCMKSRFSNSVSNSPSKRNKLFIYFQMAIQVLGRPAWLSQYSDSIRAGRSGGRIPVGARYSAHVQTSPKAYSASFTIDTGYFPGESGRGLALTPPHRAPRLKKENSYTSTPPLGLRGLFYGELYFYLYPGFW